MHINLTFRWLDNLFFLLFLTANKIQKNMFIPEEIKAFYDASFRETNARTLPTKSELTGKNNNNISLSSIIFVLKC